MGAGGRIYLMGMDNYPGVGNAPFIRQCAPQGDGAVLLCREVEVHGVASLPPVEKERLEAALAYPSAAPPAAAPAGVPPPGAAITMTTISSSCASLSAAGQLATHARAVPGEACSVAIAVRGQTSVRGLAASEVFRLVELDGAHDGVAVVEDTLGQRGSVECRCLKPL